MDAAKRRVVIKQQAAKKKEVEGQLPKETCSSNPSTKRKLSEKQGHLPKKPKTIIEPVVGLEVEGKKTVTPSWKGTNGCVILMTLIACPSTQHGAYCTHLV